MRPAILLGLIPLAVLACNGGSPSTSSPAATVTSRARATPDHPKPDGAKPPTPEAVDATRDAARKLAGNILVGGQTMRTLGELTDTFGARLTGSESYAKAAAWAIERFRSYGVDAAAEAFPLDHTWVRGEARGKIVAPKPMAVHVASMGWTPGTPPDGVRGEVLKLDDVSLEGIAKRRDDIKGKVVYYDRAAARKASLMPRPTARLAEAGAVAVITPAGKAASNVVNASGCMGIARAPCPGPAFGIGLEDAATIERLLGHGPVTLELASTAAMGGPTTVPNVVAEIRGRDKPDELVLVGAHLDSWDLATGAQDDGSGVAQVLEAARAVRALGAPPRRTIRFLLWSGEEQLFLGSRAYVKAHAAELNRVVAYLNADYGAGAPLGWNLEGRDDARKAMAPIAKELLAGLGADRLQAEARCDSDICPFLMQGVPALNLEVDLATYWDVHHLPSDTLDKVKDGALSAGAAVIAVTAYALAELPERFASRADPAALAKTLKGNDLVQVLAELDPGKP